MDKVQFEPWAPAAIHVFPSGTLTQTSVFDTWCYLIYLTMFRMVGNHFGIKIRQPTSKAKQDANKTAPAARSLASRMLGCGSMVMASQAFSRAEFRASPMSTIADAKKMETHSRVDNEEKSPRRIDAMNAVS